MKYKCPVCGFAELKEDPMSFSHTFEICPSCFAEFGCDVFPEHPETIESYRKEWIQGGCEWKSRRIERKPKGWDAIDQMRKAGMFSVR